MKTNQHCTGKNVSSCLYRESQRLRILSELLDMSARLDELISLCTEVSTSDRGDIGLSLRPLRRGNEEKKTPSMPYQGESPACTGRERERKSPPDPVRFWTIEEVLKEL